MTDSNPYQAPNAEVVEVSSEELSEPQKKDAGNGIKWLLEGLNIFKSNIWVWIGMTLVYYVIMVVVGIIPFLGFLTSIAVPVFMGGFMAACRRIDQEGSLEFGDLFEGFRDQTGPLFILGLINFGFIVLISLLVGGLSVLSAGGLASSDSPSFFGVGMILVFLVMLAAMIPLIMAFWFSPCLVMLHKVAPWEAYKLSFKGCLKNIVPFLVYGLVFLVASIVVMIVLGVLTFILGLIGIPGVFLSVPIAFVMMMAIFPIVIGSIYIGYKEIFIKA